MSIFLLKNRNCSKNKVSFNSNLSTRNWILQHCANWKEFRFNSEIQSDLLRHFPPCFLWGHLHRMGFSENMCEKEDHYRVVRLTWNNNPSLGEIPMKVALSLSMRRCCCCQPYIKRWKLFCDYFPINRGHQNNDMGLSDLCIIEGNILMDINIRVIGGFIQKFPWFWYCKNVNFVKNEISQVRFLCKLRFQKCENGENWDFWTVDFLKNEISEMWIL